MTSNISVNDVNHTYDLLLEHFDSNKEQAYSKLEEALKAKEYPLINNLATLIRNYNAGVENNKFQRVTQENARDTAKTIFVEITGAELKPTETKTESKTKTESVSKNSKNKTTSTRGKKMAAKNNSKAKETSNQELSEIANVTFEDPEQINIVLNDLTKGQIRKIENVIGAVKKSEEALKLIQQETEKAEAKLKAYQDKDVEKADAIEFEFPAFKASGIADVKVEGTMLNVLNTLIQVQTNKSISDISEVMKMIKENEEKVSQMTSDLRSLGRKIRSESPKKKATIDGIDDLDCEVVMRRASDIFVNAFGTSSPILDFEIPTLEWDEKHPDVPEIDTSFRFFAPVLADALDTLVNKEITWLHGESGCGKSEFWAQVAARIGFPLLRLNMDAHLTRADLVGTNRLVPGENGQPIMTFVEGIIPRALRIPSILLIDEMDLGDPEIMPVLQPVLEGKGIRLLEDGGRYIAPHEWSRIGITANTIGLGSSNMMYLNAHEQSAATRDRISRYIEMPYLPADMELEVVMARMPDADPEFAEKVITLANKVRDGYRLNEIHQVLSTRTVLRTVGRHARFTALYDNEQDLIDSTLENNILNRCDETSREVIKQIIDNLF